MKTAEQKLKEIWKNTQNNAKGRFFERGIENACSFYKAEGIANIEKTPEPFRVLEKNHKNGIFKGRFTANAQPDFKGTVGGGQSVVFEAKYTSTDTIKASVLTKEQAESLEAHYMLGAIAGVCVGIEDRYFFVPWRVWRDMKSYIGKKSAKATDLARYEVKYGYRSGIEFLTFVESGEYEKWEGENGAKGK